MPVPGLTIHNRGRRYPTGVVAMAAAGTGALVLLTGCSGSKHPATGASAHTSAESSASGTATSPATSPATSADPATTAAITTAYVTLFNGAAPLSQRLSYLQNSTAFEPSLQAVSTNPILKETSATVTQVSPQSATQARVLYTVALNGAPLLKDQTGVAVEINGSWKVAAASLCSLLGQEGQTPSVCRQASNTALPS
jgi:hypothetical protein